MVQASTLCMVCLEAFGLGFGADLVSRAADPEVSREQAPATRQASTPNPKIYALETAASIARSPKRNLWSKTDGLLRIEESD